ncbi:hypothetical protein GCM10022261_08260 [Brevibacterium daeguense]|uniref:Alpha-D-ribose 1-methylphosphonate 5-triphosphate synthase subunit PhnG n=1 Tax=Brevibacterium daeguense TaxID=909936 RepID=A0ABP8EH67_9MICO|nr:phosphonate C-P lyase system protein PhnG [Brevibacterium daeguense]
MIPEVPPTVGEAAAVSAEHRYECLAAAPQDELEALADRVLARDPRVRVVSGPQTVSAPVRMPVPGTEHTTSVVGHAALSTCTVELAGTRGDGIRMGRDLAGAIAAAVCDAEADRRGALAAEVERLCSSARTARAERARQRAELVSSTRVDGDL